MAAQGRASMIGRGLRLLAVLILVLGLVAGGALAAFAWAPALADQRRDLAIRLLEWLVERPVEIAGEVTLRPGRLTEVSLARVRLGDAGPEGWRGTLDLEELRFAFATLPALWGDLRIEDLAGSGLGIDLDGEAEAESEPGGSLRVSAVVRPIARFLASPLTRHIRLDDVRISRHAGPDGWSSEVILTSAVADSDAAGGRVIRLAGSFNDQPFDLGAVFAPVTGMAGERPTRPFTIEATLPGIEESIKGALDVDGETLDAEVAVAVASIGDLLQALKLRRQLEGSGEIRLQVAGPVDALAAESVRLDATLATGETLGLAGRIADLPALSGVDLRVTADLRDRSGNGMRPIDAFDVEVTGLNGRASGSLAALSVTGLAIHTSLASADLDAIGPIGVERVTRDADGRLGLVGLTVKSGDPASPSLDLSGSVGDALAGAEVELGGRFDLDLLALATDRPAPPGFGRLAGTLRLADTTGALRLHALDARLGGGGPLSLSLVMPPEVAGEPATSAELSFEIPDLDALAALFGAAPLGGGSAAFTGTLYVVDDARVIGRGHVGGSSIWLDLMQDVIENSIVVDGAIKSPRLRLADLPRMAGLAALWGKAGGDGATEQGGGEGAVSASLDAVLDTEARIVDARGAEQGRFDAKLTLRDGRAVLDPLRLAFLGGTADAVLDVALDQDPPPARLEAEVRALDTGTLLRELGAQPLLVGALDASLALTARGSDEGALRRSLAGEVALFMGPGEIGTRLLDLTAQNFVSWLFSAGSGTRLVCAASRLRLAQGIATVEGFILRTEHVQLLGSGNADLGRQTLDLTFDPRPARGGVLQAATPFRVHGPIADPSVELRSAAGLAGRAVVETVTLPFNILSSLLGGSRRSGGDCDLDQ